VTVSETQVKKILTGDAYCKFTQLSINMLISRLGKIYKEEPSAATLARCTKEINDFMSKYAAIMKHDYALISQV